MELVGPICNWISVSVFLTVFLLYFKKNVISVCLSVIFFHFQNVSYHVSENMYTLCVHCNSQMLSNRPIT